MHDSRTAHAEYGRFAFGAGAVNLGGAQLVFGDFATLWEPVQPGVPFRAALSYVVAVLLVVGGACVWSRRAVRVGAVLLGAMHVLFALLWLPRVVGFPQIYGTWGGMFEELAPATGALVLYGMHARDVARGERVAQLGRYAFGICALSFGIEHFTAVPQTADMVPAWIPGSGRFWAVATGIFHVLAGVAILAGVLATLGARLLAAMLIAFGVLIWLPRIVAAPHAHATWAGNGVNLLVAGAAWIIADWLARRERYARATPE
jgi:uncharacterized membrane protein YphA (DoxX/SURF4 family)